MLEVKEVESSAQQKVFGARLEVMVQGIVGKELDK